MVCCIALFFCLEVYFFQEQSAYNAYNIFPKQEFSKVHVCVLLKKANTCKCDRQAQGWMDGQMDGQTDGRTDRWGEK